MKVKTTFAATALSLIAGAALAADDVTLQLKWVTQSPVSLYTSDAADE